MAFLPFLRSLIEVEVQGVGSVLSYLRRIAPVLRRVFVERVDSVLPFPPPSVSLGVYISLTGSEFLY